MLAGGYAYACSRVTPRIESGQREPPSLKALSYPSSTPIRQDPCGGTGVQEE